MRFRNVFRLAHTMRRGQQHRHHAGRSLLRRSGGQRLSLGRRRDGRRHVQQRSTLCANDGVYGIASKSSLIRVRTYQRFLAEPSYQIQFVGPEVGPVIGGFINQYTNWRWSFWVLLIWAGVQWTLILFFVPETYAPVLLRRKAIKLRQETGDNRVSDHMTFASSLSNSTGDASASFLVELATSQANETTCRGSCRVR